MSKKLLMFAAAIIVFIAGCTSPFGGKKAEFSTTQGAVVKDLRFDAPSILDDEEIGFSVTVENVGAKTIDGTTNVWLYGPAMSTTDDKTKWSILSPADKFSSGAITWAISGSNFQPPTEDSPGDVAAFTASFKPPNLGENMEDSYNFDARLCYPYKTTSGSVLTSTARDEYKTSAPSSATEADSRNSAGPIQVDIQAKENIRLGDGGRAVSLVFAVSDVGGGFSTEQNTCTVNPDKAERNKVKLTVTVDGEETDCKDKSVTIRNGGATVYCTYTFSSDVPKSEYHILATAEYNYYVTQSTTIIVKDSFLPEADE